MPDCNRALPIRVDLRLTEEERQYLNKEALDRGVSRQELLRKLVLTPEGQTAEIPAYKPVMFALFS